MAKTRPVSSVESFLPSDGKIVFSTYRGRIYANEIIPAISRNRREANVNLKNLRCKKSAPLGAD